MRLHESARFTRLLVLHLDAKEPLRHKKQNFLLRFRL